MFDLAIIGGGPAGYTAAERAAVGGLSVVLFETNQLGGVCLNEGCIPTKTLLYSAKLYHNALVSAKYGVVCGDVQFDYEKMVLRKNKVVRKLNAAIRAKMTAHHITVINGAAVASKTADYVSVLCNDQTFEAKHLLIATGSKTAIPPIKNVESAPFWTSREALETKRIPQSLVIIGGGVIGMEFAGLFATFGCKVSVVEMAPEILPSVDCEIASLLRAEYEQRGIAFYTGAKVLEINENSICYANATGENTITAEQLLICVGRRPNLDGVESLGLDLSRAGIRTDATMRTSEPCIYAVGDVTGYSMLAHTAEREAEVAVNNILGKTDQMSYHAVPAVVYTNPEVAGVGRTEEEMCLAGQPYQILKLPMTYSGRFVAENEGGNGLCKLVIDAREVVVGAHLIGNPASELISSAVMAVESGMTVSQFRKIIFPHPSVSEIFKETLFVS
ncbi:MAG: dihydrolipoyl dehydrogenase [Prevotellaceae bacterium]|jgi:dihydrolipoamide dehydrogenase|nr:dihydrolipoyl dehydrogenase [Prevotellaceae bacterium]